MSDTVLEYDFSSFSVVPDEIVWGDYTFARIGITYLYQATTIVTSLPSSTPPPSTTVPNSTYLSSVTIGDKVTSIGNIAFQNCSLKTITFAPGSRLKTIGDSAFQACLELESISIPASVTSIGNNAFTDAFQNSSSATVTFVTGSILATIGDSAFQYSPLESIEIPDSVTSIGTSAFQECSKLATVTFVTGSILATIGDSAFRACLVLESIEIPDLVTSIGINAFASCNALASITIPVSVTSIGENAFEFSGLTNNGTATPPGVVTIDQSTLNTLEIQVDGNIASQFRGATNVTMFITCYEANTLILILENEEEVYKKVSKLKVGDLVKTYKQGYKKIKLLHSFKYKPPNRINGLNMLYKHKENGVIVTGGHSILVDELTEQEKINNLKHNGFNETIEDKKLLLACSSDKFEKIDDCCKEYHLYHFSLESDDPKEHFGVYITDGILSESCPEEAMKSL